MPRKDFRRCQQPPDRRVSGLRICNISHRSIGHMHSTVASLDVLCEDCNGKLKECVAKRVWLDHFQNFRGKLCTLWHCMISPLNPFEDIWGGYKGMYLRRLVLHGHIHDHPPEVQAAQANTLGWPGTESETVSVSRLWCPTVRQSMITCTSVGAFLGNAFAFSHLQPSPASANFPTEALVWTWSKARWSRAALSTDLDPQHLQ